MPQYMKLRQVEDLTMNKNFIMVVIGQIISLFGNAILRFALPLYLLNQTGSAGLFGIISACSFIPMIVLAPVGGIFADRVNKRNIMVILDFSTATLILILTILLGKVNLVVLLLVTMIILYGIQGAYQPAVQASIPVLLPEEYIMQGNAVINLVSSLASLLGPIVGGTLFAAVGIRPILFISIICFVASAVMEIFIKIPHTKRKAEGNIFVIGFSDLKESFRYMGQEEPIIFKLSLVIAAINMFLSASMMIGLPVFVTQMLGFDADTGNRLYGYVQAVMGAGSLLGGVSAGVFAKRLKPQNGYLTLLVDSITLLPIALAIVLPLPDVAAYGMIIVSSFFMMLLASLFSVQIMSYLQMVVPEEKLGKIVSCAMCIGMCASPIGQAIYGALFECISGKAYLVVMITAGIGVGIALASKGLFRTLAKVMKQNNKKKEDEKNLQVANHQEEIA